MTNQIPAPPAREAAWALLTEFTQSPSLLKHALAVECCVRAYGEEEARRRGLVGEDAAELVNLYSVTGLLHDFDYERHPSADEHPYVGVRVLERARLAGSDAPCHPGPRRIHRHAAHRASGEDT